MVRQDEYAGRFAAGQTTYLFVDDAGTPPSERLRDPVLSGYGVDHARCVGEHLPPEHSAAHDGRRVLIVVLPLTRAVMTTALLFHKLSAGDVEVALEPRLREVYFAPYPVIENMGRDAESIFADCRAQLKAEPASVQWLLDKLAGAAMALPDGWWHPRFAPGQLIQREAWR